MNCVIKYLLGIDGGGTKTEFLLTDLSYNVLNRIVSVSSNPVNIGIDSAISVLKNGIDDICKGIDLSEISVFAGLSGAGNIDIRSDIEDFFSSLGFGNYKIGTDADSAVAVALHGQDGIALLLGTGIICYYVKNGCLNRIGGRGFMIDKGGSGFCYGSDVLNAAFEHLDGRENSKVIFELVENRLGKKLEDAVSDIYSGGASYVASFAPVAFEAYKRGDVVAEKIINRNLSETAKIINTAKSNFNDSVSIVICGGLTNEKEIIRDILPRYLSSGVSFEFLQQDIVYGALLIGKEAIEGGRDYA